METPTQKSPEVISSAIEQENHIRGNEENHGETCHKQLVLYDPAATANKVRPSRARKKSLPNYTSRAFPDGGVFVVQCDKCFKWRYIPTKEKYEKIREQILERPFYCETACEWRPDISCDNTPDLTQNGSTLWAIDKPNIPQPPPGWERLLRIRAEGGTKFADVYLEQHPEYATQGVKLEVFSFQTPSPLQEDYVKKRHPTPLHDINVAYDVDPISWAPPKRTTYIFGEPVPSASLHVPDGNS